MVLQSTQAADQAKAAVGAELGRRCRTSWPSARSCSRQLDQAKMQEQMNTAMATLSASR